MALSLLLTWLIQTFGYIGIFAAAAIMNATIIIPLPATFVSVLGSAILNPWLVGIMSGLGAGLGQFTAYGAGYAGRELLAKKIPKKKFDHDWKRAEKLFAKYGGIVIFFSTFTPIPDIVGMYAGSIKYNTKKFYFFSATSKIVLYTIFAVTGRVLFRLF